jgi:hypothetical protein
MSRQSLQTEGETWLGPREINFGFLLQTLDRLRISRTIPCRILSAL